MRLSGKQWVQVILSFGIAIWIFWFLYKDISLQSLVNSIKETSLFWLSLSILVSLFGFYLRAWRWKLLIVASDKSSVSTSRTFLAVMIGYLANLIVPRAGEVARCGVLSKTNEIQMGKLIGTVILERTVDLVFLMGVVTLGFVIERELFISLFLQLVAIESLLYKISELLPILIGGIFVFLILTYFLFQKYRDHGIIWKIRHFIRDVVNGIISVKRVSNQWGFWGSSVLIWVTYYLTMVLVAWAIPSTVNLSLSSVLMVMVMGSIGMIAPVQGGIGTFHALVAFILMAYGLTNEEGKIFAVIIHGSQVITIIVLGLVSLLIFMKIISKKASKTR